ncbi:MAG: NADH-quinone oxidoreductase subunit E [Ignavibacteria bacterium GWF2_33_9]|nr:MAG: NADH-quinone oxidoreductase subunit E [Ignavibacteria bacterium GWF2_33_9]
MEIIFNETELKEVEKIKSKYPTDQSALMGVLWLAQKKFGWISNDVMAYVAGLLNLSPAHVEGVARFYTMYFKKPMGKYHVQVCTNVSCMLRGGENIWEFMKDKLSIGHMEVTPDGKFSLEEVECMGACGGAPMIAINEDYYENISINRIEQVLSTLE